ncbi:MAG TPA: transcriptional regulator [Tepidisphaeraceae bacterium]|nr:transcriptional regulator [Tepidisphaeraceae bacterium]
MSESNRTPGSFAFEGLERTIHEKARLSVLSSLAANPDGLLFTELKTLCSLTDGNLSRQIQLLQSAGLVEVWKRFHLKRPQTLCRLTDDGRARFLEYVAELEKVVAVAQTVERSLNKENSLPPAIPAI